MLHVFAAYAAIVFVAMLINLICANGLEFDGTGTWWTAIMYAAAANVVTKGAYLAEVKQCVGCTSKGASWLAGIVQMALGRGGLMLNVVCFAVVVSKFQQPRSRLVFASHFCVTKRDGGRVLLIRLANRRCNLILHPEIRVLFHAARDPRRRVLHRAERAPARDCVLGDDGRADGLARDRREIAPRQIRQGRCIRSRGFL